MSRRESQRERARERARVSQTESECARMCKSEPERELVSQREQEWVRVRANCSGALENDSIHYKKWFSFVAKK